MNKAETERGVNYEWLLQAGLWMRWRRIFWWR